MRLVSIEELKSIQLEILDDVHRFCTTNGLRYSLTGGTLIGAIRHHGYIPWDDDIDVMLPRPDYERFLRTYHSDENEVIDLMHSGLCVETFAKVSRKGTLVTDPKLGRSLWGINIDLFPVDGFPGENTRAHFDRVDSINKRLGVFCPFFKIVKKNKGIWFVKYLLKRLFFFYPHSYLHFKARLEQLLKSYPFDDSPMAALFCGGDGWREVMPKEVFDSYIEKDFEGKQYHVIAHYDDYLKRVFGDYMQFPPEEERVNKHAYDNFVL